MTSQSPQQEETTAHPGQPSPPGRSPHAMTGRHSAAPGSELAADLRSGTGYHRCYELFAPRLYRYCWTLLGPGGSSAEPDRAAAALHETFLVAAHRIDALRDDREFAAWLFALARAAARRRGFTPRSPYAQLATAEDERSAVQLSLRLPPSHRELLELYLRHGLPAPLIARVLGLDAETAAELCRTAVLRAADQLSRYALAPDQTQG
ncbi:RNA polymerase sigma factor, partial [Streptomonospora algeriensis]